MKPELRVTWAAALALGLAAAPAAAQDTAAPAPPPEGVVGPPQLRDFSLGGTVTRPAEPAPPRSETPVGSATQQPRQDATRAPVQSRAVAAPSATSRAEPARQAERRVPSAERTDAVAGQASLAGRPAGLALPPSSGLDAPPTPAPSGSLASLPVAAPATLPAPDPLPLDDGGPSPLPWLLALLLGGGAAAYYFRRQRPGGYALAGAAGGAGTIDLGTPRVPQPKPHAPPQPHPAPPQVNPRMPAPGVRQPLPEPAATLPPVPAPRAPSIPGAVVSTRLRPWLDVEFIPGRTIVDEARATIECEVVLHNSGAAPARDVLVEARMFNAGPEQDREIAAFFERPLAKGERSGSIAPLQCSTFKLAVSLTHQQLRQFEVDGRRLFVPLIGVNALYRWSGGDAQTSAAFLIGRETKGDKMGPFRLDLGPRVFRGLAVRELPARVRK